MISRSIVPGVAVLLLAAAPLRAQDADEGHRRVYRKTCDSVVAIRVMAPLGERSGSGVVLTKDGLILTSYAACPEGATDLRVWMKGPRLYKAELVATSKKDELSLLKISPRGELKAVEMAPPGGVRVGQVSYTIGNAANSIIDTDQPSFNVGIVSALYRLAEERANSTYVGPVFETTAAVNVGMEGAPCLDAEGRMVGFVTLNYSPHRFLGTAIPLDEIRRVIERLKESRAAEVAETPAGKGWLGLKLKEAESGLAVEEIEPGGPGDQAGFSKGDVLLALGESPVKTARQLEDLLKEMEAGSIVWFKARSGTKVETFKVTLGSKK